MPKEKLKYQAKWQSLGRIYESKGKSVEEALINLPITWKEVKGRGFLTVNGNDKKFEKMLFGNQFKRILVGNINRQWWVKKINFVLS